MTPPGTEAESEPDDWVLVFRVKPHALPDVVRIRHILKCADDVNLQCVLVRNKTEAERLEIKDWEW